MARALLVRVIGRLPSAAPYVVQLLSFDRDCGNQVSRAFCVAAASHFGSVLKVELAPAEIGIPGDKENIVPDAAMPRLYHGRLRVSSVDCIRFGRAAVLRAVDADAGSYALVVAQSDFVKDGSDAVIMASAFGGTVLVAKAGVTTLHQLLAASDAVRQSGGLLLGVVLADVPPRPAWIHRLGPS